MTPRVAIVSSGLGHVTRGIESWATTVAEGIHKTGGNAILFGGGPRTGVRSPYVCVPNWRRGGWMRKFISWDKAYLLEQVTFARNLRHHLRGDRFDIVHVADPNVAQQLIRTCANRNLALIYQDGLSIGPIWTSKFSHVQALAPFYKDEAKAAGINTAGWRVVPHLVDTKTFAPVLEKRVIRETLFKGKLPTEASALLAVGDFSAQGSKRLDWVIDELSKAKSSAHLILAGSASEEDLAALRSRAESKLSARVHFFPNISHLEMPGLYQAADFFVHAATREPFGIVLIEAMASGLPILGHQFAVTQWIVADGGITLDMAKEGELAKGIERIFFEPNLRQSLSEKAIARARAVFDKNVVLPMYHGWYQELAQRQDRR